MKSRIGPIGWVAIAGAVIGGLLALPALGTLVGWAVAQGDEIERYNWEGYAWPSLACLVAGLQVTLLSLILFSLDRQGR